MAITLEQIRTAALALPATEEALHHGKVSFRVKQKIFATVNLPHGRATVRLTPELQDVFVAMGKGAVYAVPNKWGQLGWTHLHLESAPWELFEDALKNAWYETAPLRIRQMLD